MIEYVLPFPPSTNNLFLNSRGKGRILSPEYRAWKEQAGWQLKSQRPKPLGVRAFVQIDLDNRRKGDADNRAKPVLDLLVEHQVLAGDSKKHVRRVSIGWEPVSGCRVILCEAAP
jgi:Holliday junction resolvase RusA-like endonuclease